MNTISLEAAESISNLTVFGFGMALVFVGLICIIAICSIMGAICKRFIKENSPTQAAISKKSNGEIQNKGEIVAAIACAIAEDLGTDISGIRIKTLKKL